MSGPPPKKANRENKWIRRWAPKPTAVFTLFPPTSVLRNISLLAAQKDKRKRGACGKFFERAPGSPRRPPATGTAPTRFKETRAAPPVTPSGKKRGEKLESNECAHRSTLRDTAHLQFRTQRPTHTCQVTPASTRTGEKLDKDLRINRSQPYEPYGPIECSDVTRRVATTRLPRRRLDWVADSALCGPSKGQRETKERASNGRRKRK